MEKLKKNYKVKRGGQLVDVSPQIFAWRKWRKAKAAELPKPLQKRKDRHAAFKAAKNVVNLFGGSDDEE